MASPLLFSTLCDRPREECGVFGVFNHPNAAAITALGLHALQHRGQEAAGIVAFNGSTFSAERKLGLVSEHFSKNDIIKKLPGDFAIGHVRYSTTGHTTQRNIQPLFADFYGGGFACAHNGNLTNGLTLRNKLVHEGAIFHSTSDTETILQLVAKSKMPTTVERLIDTLYQIQGAYALIALTNKKIIGVRDPLGIRPLIIGQVDGSYVLCSETCALDIIGAKFIREVEPGELIVISKDGMQSLFPLPRKKPRPCIFEYVYFSRPDSMLHGLSVYNCRKNFGARLAQEHPVKADVVVPVPDSGVPAALGYAAYSGIPFEYGLIRNHYVGRTFIEPTQQMRQSKVKLKHSINRAQIANKDVVLVDDSIVRGTTCMKIIQMIFEAGARKVHLRVASPPITHCDFYGIDTPVREDLIAVRHNLEGIKNTIQASSLGFLSIDGLYKAMGHAQGRDANNPHFTDHCFTGDYPTPLMDRDKNNLSPQLSLLADIA